MKTSHRNYILSDRLLSDELYYYIEGPDSIPVYNFRSNQPDPMYNRNMVKTRNMPDADRISVLAATIMLAFTLTRFIEFPATDLSIQLPGLFLPLQINIYTVVAFLTAGLTASGADWLLRDHPALKGQRTFQHWILPALTAWVVGIPLFQFPLGLMWWVIFAVGGALLMLVLVAEYIVVDPQDVRQPPAMAGLTAVSFALYLILAIVLRSSGVRLYIILPALVLGAGLVSLRTLNLRSHGQWQVFESGVIAFLIGQMTAALHYWPLSPVSFGLALLGPTYALTSMIGSLSEGESLSQVWIAPTIVLLVSWGIAIWIR